MAIPGEERVTRRRLLELGVGAGSGALAAYYAGLAFLDVRPNPAPPGKLQNLGPVSKFPVHEATFVVYTGEGVEDGLYVVRHSQGQPIVFDQHCTHLQCPIQWYSSIKEFLCPCHGSIYDENGNVLHGPAPRPLHRHYAKVQSGDLIVGGIVS